ncbi:hypothetical protein FNV43_RR08088 [Rhamnella rubrinervis]|uniref:DNA N(6)-methyladenine demethylase n=1 Tax=Rhamnella rubrinervis TaxID=2594499 RepID=A0A8K0HG45_9ROSA|nr:hypothetical protein FNV43_RR08088 [Rhamnella rubrinervis]
MNRGRSRGNQRRGNSSPGAGGGRQSPRPRDQPPPDRPYPSPGYTGNNSKEVKSASSSAHERDGYSLSAPSGSKELHMGAQRKQVGETTGMVGGEGVALDSTMKLSMSCQKSETHLPPKSSDCGPSLSKGPQTTGSHNVSENYERPAVFDPFDICPPKTSIPIVLKPPLLVKNRERRNEIKRSVEAQNGFVLRSGMVLLKGCISLDDQVKIVKVCRGLGLGPGGFYQPGYRDGAKLHLKMMCLGKNWDPETSEYGDQRPIDGTRPPIIPLEFNQLVEKAIKNSHSLIGNECKAGSVEDILPWMIPNLCIVNFYSSSGRLGLHQDRDESPESLDKGLPVVSFSIGDAAEFLYGDERDVEKAEKIVLESGDILIFGGKSRHVFHGVTAIKPNTAPKALQEATNLRPGRLNLTFREY